MCLGGKSRTGQSGWSGFAAFLLAFRARVARFMPAPPAGVFWPE
jgi:hypothetical protein